MNIERLALRSGGFPQANPERWQEAKAAALEDASECAGAAGARPILATEVTVDSCNHLLGSINVVVLTEDYSRAAAIAHKVALEGARESLMPHQGKPEDNVIGPNLIRPFVILVPLDSED